MSEFLIDTKESRLRRLRKSILTAARLVQSRPVGAVRWVPVMVTLTYRANVEWEAGQVRAFVQTVRAWGLRAGYRLPIMWVMELHKSGRPHYHVLVWLPRRLRLPRSDARGWWPHGMTNTVRARNGYGYLAKYASKGGGEGMACPKGARLFGVSGLMKKERHVVAWWHLPKRLRTGAEGSVYYRRLPGGAFEDASNGALHFSELRAVVLSGRWVKLVPDGMTHEDRQFRYQYASTQAVQRAEIRKARGPVPSAEVDYAKIAECDQYERYLKARALVDWLANASWVERIGYFDSVTGDVLLESEAGEFYG